MRLSKVIVGAFAAAVSVSAHPGHDHTAEMAERAAALSQFARRDLSHCAEKIKARGLEARAVARRSEMISKLRKKRGIECELLTLPTQRHA